MLGDGFPRGAFHRLPPLGSLGETCCDDSSSRPEVSARNRDAVDVFLSPVVAVMRALVFRPGFFVSSSGVDGVGL